MNILSFLIHSWSSIRIVRITWQGFPAATTFAGISLVTTLPAPIMQLSPIVTPGRRLTFAPSQT